MYTKIIGTGSYLPEQVRTNADLEKMVDTSDEWIVTRTGIRERHIERPDWPDRCGNDFCYARFPERSLSDSKHVGH